MRKMFFAVAVIFFVLIGFSTHSFAHGVKVIPPLTGKIVGQITLCGASEGVEGTLVYIAGKSIMAKLGPDGTFVLYNVPWGVQTLTVETPDGARFTIPDVQVRCFRTKYLGVQDLCPDNDGDGFTQLDDCDDNDPNTYPGAPEICGDQKDNNCDGTIDEEGCTTPPPAPAPTAKKRK